jgi:hypothetical protein
VPLDPPIARLDKAGAQLIATVQNQQLGRYLQRTARIKDPGRDLLYLESAGALADIQDSALGQLIEDLAPDAPDAVVKELASRPSADQLKSLPLLMDMADREVGLERANCMQALLGVADQLGPDVAPQADRIAQSVGSYLLEQPLPEASLASALRLACRAHAAGRPIEQWVINDSGLLADRVALMQAAELLGELQSASSDLVLKRLDEEASADTTYLVEALPHMSRDGAASLLKATTKPIQTTLTTTEATGGAAKASEFSDSVWTALARVRGADSDLFADFNWILLQSGTQGAYDTVHSHASEWLPQLGDTRRTRHAVMALTRAPERDWALWSSMIASTQVEGVEDQFLVGAIKSVFSRATWSQPDAVSAGTTAIGKVATATEPDDPTKFAAEVATAIQPVIGARLWWLTAADRQIQTAIHTAVAALGACEPLVPVANSLAVAQLTRALPPTAPVTSETYAGLRAMGSLLNFDSRRELVRHIQASAGQPQLPVPAGVSPAPPGLEPLGTVAYLIAVDPGSLAAADWGIATGDVCSAVQTTNSEATEIAATWLRLEPSASDVGQLAAAWIGRSVTPIRDALKLWVGTDGSSARTELAVELIRASSAPDGWISVLAEAGLDEDALVSTLQSELGTARQFERRERLVDYVLEVRPTTRSAQRGVGEFALELLSSEKKNDFELACRLGPALGEAHRAAGQLSTAINSAISTHGWTVADTHRRSLEAAGIRIRRRRSLRDRLRGRD